MNLTSFLLRRRPGKRVRAATNRLRLETLEDRVLLSVNLQSRHRGIFHDDLGVPESLPYADVAVGPDYIVETAGYYHRESAHVAFFQKSTGDRTHFERWLDFFHGLPDAPDAIGNLVVTYAEPVQRFVVAALDVQSSPGMNTTFLDVAVSDTANPNDGFSQQQRVQVYQGPADVFGAHGEYLRLGWNADALVATLNTINDEGFFDHVQVVAFDRRDLARVYQSSPPGHRSIVPATMHGSQPGDPLWLVENDRNPQQFDYINVVRMTDVVSDFPTFTETRLSLPISEDPPQPAPQRGGPKTIPTWDGSMMNAAWRNGRLVAAHTVRRYDPDSPAVVSWYEFDTNGASPTLTQYGLIGRGERSSYFPAIDIASNGNLGMTFMQSSADEYLSMYVTGQKAGMVCLGMQPPVVAFAGGAYYDPGFPGAYVDSFGGISMDPTADGSFWAVKVFKPPTGGPDNWGTGIANFSIDGLIDVGTLGGPPTSIATAVNNSCEVVGYSPAPTGISHAFLWQAFRMFDLGTLGGPESEAYAVNRVGHIVGVSTNRSGTERATNFFVVEDVDLGTLPGGWLSRAYAINLNFQVVGASTFAPYPDETLHAFLRNSDGTWTDLGDLGGGVSEAHGINDSGQVVGFSNPDPARVHAFLWQNGTMTDLGTLGGDSSEAFAINASGQVVGWSIIQGGARHPFLWQNGTMTDLGTFGGDGEAHAINASGQVAGSSSDAGNLFTHACVWQNGTITDLNDLLPPNSGWTLQIAWGINDTGVVVGQGRLNGQDRAFLLYFGTGGGGFAPPRGPAGRPKPSLRIDPGVIQVLISSSGHIQPEGVTASAPLLNAWQANAGQPLLRRDLPAGPTTPASSSLIALSGSMRRQAVNKLFAGQGWSSELEPSSGPSSFCDLDLRCLTRLA